MKRYLLLPLLILATGLFAQRERSATANKNQPGPDPTLLGDFEPPTVSCINGLSANIMPTGMINLWATDFLLDAHDNATPFNLLRFGIRKAGTGSGFPVNALGDPNNNIILTCNEVGASNPVELWVMDLAGNTAFCLTEILLQDNFSNCGGGLQINVCAQALCSGMMIETVQFDINGTSNFLPPFSYFDLSDTSGCLKAFNNVPIASNFNVSAEKDDSPLNGVTMADLELISKHLHGTALFTEPWQWIAADANRDGFITLEDSIELSKLILGEYQELPNNTSWRFVASGYAFPSPNPLAQPIPENISVANILTNMDTLFLGIKIGDLDCTAVPNFRTPGHPIADKTDPAPDPTQLGDYAPPTVTCLNGLSVNLMPTGNIMLWASDFLQYTHDNATPTNQIKLGIRKEGTGIGFPQDSLGNSLNTVLYTCDDLGATGIELWAKDWSGNTAKCLTYVIVQDNLGNCSGGDPEDWLIRVCAKTEPADGVEEISYSVVGTNPNEPFYANQVSGDLNNCGYFKVPLGSDVTTALSKDDNPLNGVSTYDLVLISKHILGIEPLNSPYKMIAADADRNGVIDSTDIEELWRLIVGIYTELPNNTSWRFVDQSYVFPDNNNPFLEVFPESISVQNIQSQISANFVAIKVGDVNNTAVHNYTGQVSEERISFSASNLIGEPRPNPTNAEVALPVYLYTDGNLHVQLNDLSGRVLWQENLMLEKGNHTLEIPATGMPCPGLYVWRVQVGEQVKAGKLVRY